MNSSVECKENPIKTDSNYLIETKEGKIKLIYYPWLEDISEKLSPKEKLFLIQLIERDIVCIRKATEQEIELYGPVTEY